MDWANESSGPCGRRPDFLRFYRRAQDLGPWGLVEDEVTASVIDPPLPASTA